MRAILARALIVAAACCLVVVLSAARAQDEESWDESAPPDEAAGAPPEGGPEEAAPGGLPGAATEALPDVGSGSPIDALPENARLPTAAPKPTVCVEDRRGNARIPERICFTPGEPIPTAAPTAAPQPTVCVEVRTGNERTPERICRSVTEPTVCTIEFDESKLCQKVKCSGDATMPDPDHILESPCCGRGFAIISLQVSKGGGTIAECCPAEKVCGPLPRPGGPMSCSPNPFNCNTQPGRRRSCPPGTDLVEFDRAGIGSTLLCCRQGEACEIFAPRPAP